MDYTWDFASVFANRNLLLIGLKNTLILGAVCLALGLFLGLFVGAARFSRRAWLYYPATVFVEIFRNTPVLVQIMWFFFAFPILVPFKIDAFTAATLGLALNTTAFASEIYRAGLQSIPKGDTEAADAYGISGWSRFKRIIWPTMLRLAWPAYTNEAIFLFHATTLVFFTGFPALQQRGDALYYASYFADKTFNPFIPYPILAGYFILLTLVIIAIFGLINRRLNRHVPQAAVRKIRLRLNLIR